MLSQSSTYIFTHTTSYSPTHIIIVVFDVYCCFRIQILEIENKRSGTKKISDAEANNNAEALESLTQELVVMRKDILTAERIAKQAEVIRINKKIYMEQNEIRFFL